ncbi:AAA family ATPase [Sharpea azabuensis]|uniref:AAA family ATPase n=1 Tax=Sharpea azabuensis TaxID=322505 RepID=UPI00156A1970|nr:AAA family ATPase [Sharpea azabuensis]
MEKKKKFLKVGDKIVFRSSVDGLEYDLEPGVVYTIEINRYTDEVNLIIGKPFNMPSKIYTTPQDDKFVNKVINSYKTADSNTLGVMLSGLKGSGKTLLSKVIAMKSELPIIVIDNYIHPKILNKVLKSFEGVEVCILFDEVDKNGEDYDDNYLLRILDGVENTGKKMMLFTANEGEDINQYMKDRCSRIRYWREFEEVPASLIIAMLEDKLNDKSKCKELTDFIQDNFSCISFDNVLAFANEVNNNPDDAFEELFEDMNLSKK